MLIHIKVTLLKATKSLSIICKKLFNFKTQADRLIIKQKDFYRELLAYDCIWSECVTLYTVFSKH